MGKLRSIGRRMQRQHHGSRPRPVGLCPCCGEQVNSDTLDVEQYRPGSFARLGPNEKSLCEDSSDIVVIPRGVGDSVTDTWHIRCMLYLPIQGEDPRLRVGLGLWARVPPDEGQRYRAELMAHRGVIMGTLDGEVPVMIKSKPGRGRPILVVQDQPDPSAWAEHLLKWQREGFPSLEEAHQFVRAFVRPSSAVVPEELS